MLRRLFFLLPDESQGSALVADLGAAGVGRENLHAVTGGGRLLQEFPPATARQQRDSAWRLQNSLWNGNLGLFVLAALGFIFSLSAGSTLWVLVTAAIMVATFVAGAGFVYHLPDTHLGEFNISLRHGDIVLMVDVPRQRANEITQLVRRRHPEAEVNGVGWTIQALGL